MSKTRANISTRAAVSGGVLLLLVGCGQGFDAESQSTVAEVNVGASPSPTVGGAAEPGWRHAMANTPLPHNGCFRATMPDSAWTEVPCQPPRTTPLLPSKYAKRTAAVGGGALVGGGGNGDFMAQVSSGTISSAEGIFPSVSGVNGFGVQSEPFMLQLNSNQFPTTVCGGSCKGWQQFIVESEPLLGSVPVYMQYWMIDYGPSCPSGWNSYGTSDCWMNSSESGFGTIFTLADLVGTKLTGQTNATQDEVIFFLQGGNASAIGNDSVLHLAAGWTAAEFNAFGDGGGSEAIFYTNSSVTAQVQTSVANGTLAAPSCWNNSTTAETNNLSLNLSSCCPFPGSGTVLPSIAFTEADVSVAAPFCLLNELGPIVAPTL